MFFFPYIGNNNPNQLIFFSGVETTNQIKKRLPGKMIYKWKVFHIRLSLLCQVLDWTAILGFSSDIEVFFAKHRIVVFLFSNHYVLYSWALIAALNTINTWFCNMLDGLILERELPLSKWGLQMASRHLYSYTLWLSMLYSSLLRTSPFFIGKSSAKWAMFIHVP